MANYYDEKDLAEMEKKKKALKSAAGAMMPKVVEDLQHTIKATDQLDMGEPCYDRNGNIKKCGS